MMPLGLTAAPHLDAQLLRLSVLLDEAWASENAAYANEVDDDAGVTAIRVTSAVVEKIAAQHAQTIDGLLVKARALMWCRDGNPLEVRDLDLGEATETHVLVGIVRDLSRMGRRA